MRPDAVELSTAQAWFLAERLGAGTFPWVLAITQPYSDAGLRRAFEAEQTGQLTQMGVLSADGEVNPIVGEWITMICRPRRWLELRWVSGRGDLLRGLAVRTGDRTVVALRNGDLMTCTELAVGHPQALLPVLTSGLGRCAPACFDEFSLPARVGAKADERLRNGESLADVMTYLGIPPSAHHVVEAAFAPQRSYVEVVAGDHCDGYRVSTEVGFSLVDTAVGRVVVRPVHADDGNWISIFQPGTELATAIAVQQLTASLPDGPWFPNAPLTRDFEQTSRSSRTRKKWKEHVPQHIN